jgi:site-specific DNA-methyltransferase (adenine-specific)
MRTNIIYNKDCIEGMKELPDESVDMILCDLPYGTTCAKWDTIINLDKLWEQYKRIIKPRGTIVLTSCQPFTSKLVMSNLEMFKYEWVWYKTDSAGFFNAKNCPVKKHENILVFSKGTIANCSPKLMKYNPQGLTPTRIKRKNSNRTDQIIGERPSRKEDYIQTMTNYPVSVIYFKNDKLGIHDVSKPVALFEYLIKTYSNEGNLILDNCMGSGTTAIACINTNRQFIGFEIDPQYYKISLDRLSDKTSTLPNGNPNGEFNKDLTATQQVATPKCPPDTSLNPNIKSNLGFPSQSLK